MQINKGPLTPEELEENRKMSMKVLESSIKMYEDTKRTLKADAERIVDKHGNQIYSNKQIQDNYDLVDTMEKDQIQKYLELGGKQSDIDKIIKKKATNRKHLAAIMQKMSSMDMLNEYLNSMNSENVETLQQEVTEEVKPVETIESERMVVGFDKGSDEGDKTGEMIMNSIENMKGFSKDEISTFINMVNKKEIEVKPVDVKTEITSELIQYDDLTVGAAGKGSNGGKQLYDIIKLPSHGMCYRNRKDTVKVGYLTAFDENMILSPQLYQDGSFIDYMVQSKVLDENFNVEDLVQGDRDAIIIWLRATSYGNEYPIRVTDDETGKEFDTICDLSQLNYKKFTLTPDANGYFQYTLPVSGDIIKFKFLTLKDYKFLNKLKQKESKFINARTLNDYCDKLFDLSNESDLISQNSKLKIKECIRIVRDDLEKNYDQDKDLTFSHELTDRLLMQTISVNGVTDRKYINDYILNMNVKDAAEYRKYIVANEPGIDYNIEVQRPESLGGGSIKSFLQLDQFIFINV